MALLHKLTGSGVCGHVYMVTDRVIQKHRYVFLHVESRDSLLGKVSGWVPDWGSADYDRMGYFHHSMGAGVASAVPLS